MEKTLKTRAKIGGVASKSGSHVFQGFSLQTLCLYLGESFMPEIIIEHSRTKRRIVGPCNICGHKRDLVDFATQILDKASREDFFYGWVSIVSARQPSIANTEPETWD
jgi:hypothetical protein